MKVGDKVKLLVNGYTDSCGSLDMSPGQTGVISEIPEWNDQHSYVVIDGDPEQFPYYMYDYEIEVI